MAPSQHDVTYYPHITNLSDPQGLYALLQVYLAHLRIRQYSEATQAIRQRHLLWFLEWCGQRGLLRPGEITKPILARYQRSLFHYRKPNGRPLSPRTQHGHLTSLRGWFTWLVKEDYLPTNPASGLELPKLPRSLPKAVLSESEAESVLRVPDIHTPWGLRDRAILETFYSTGIRRVELIRLTLACVDRERGTLMVRQGKGNKDRLIPIGERALSWIDKYLDDARPALSCGRDDGILFLSQYGEALSPDGLSARVKRYVEQANVGKQGSCHIFRHTMATLMLEHGADIRFIQAMLGHASMDTTQVYTRLSIHKLKEVHTRTHPAKARRTKTVDWDADSLHDLEDEPEATEAALLATLAAEDGDD